MLNLIKKLYNDSRIRYLFFGGLTTMAVEVGGVPFCVEILHQPQMIAKLETQVIVTIVNYFISKFLVFKSQKK